MSQDKAATNLKNNIWNNFTKIYSKYSHNKDEIDTGSIKKLLIDVLKQESQSEQDYVMRNLNRIDRDENRIISMDELGNFLIKRHCGQMSLQRRHKESKMKFGSQRKMDQEEFASLLNEALASLGVKCPEQTAKSIFAKTDKDKDSKITYAEYFSIIAEYACIPPPIPEPANNELASKIRARVFELIVPHDVNKDKRLDSNEISHALKQIYGDSQIEIQYVLKNPLRYDTNKSKAVTYDELTDFCVGWHFGEIAVKRQHAEGFYKKGEKRIMNRQEFSATINYSLKFIKLKASEQVINDLFASIDTDKDGWISYSQYFFFTMNYFKPFITNDPTDIPDEEWYFNESLNNQLKSLFNKYDKGSKSYLTIDEYKQFVAEVLTDCSQAQLDYIFNNLFRVDVNYNGQIDFYEFASFTLNYTADVAIERRHQKGKDTLTENNFNQLVNSSFYYLKTVPKDLAVTNKIFNRIKKNGEVTSVNFLEWANHVLSAKYKKQDK